MMTHSCWRARNETRCYIAPSDVCGDPATVRLFAQATETTGYDRLDAGLLFAGRSTACLGPRHWPTRRCGAILPAALKEGMMAEAKLAPNLSDWMVEHTNCYLASGGADGHMYKIDVPGRGEITAPALLLTTTGRKSGDKFILPLFYGADGDSYFVIASKGGAPQHPGWYRNILANADVEVQVGTKKLKARARTATGDERIRLWKKALEFWPPYADYQLKTDREIPVVVLEPIHD